MKQLKSLLARVLLPNEVIAGPIKIVPTVELSELGSRIASAENKFSEMTHSQLAGAISLGIGGNVNRLLYAAAECRKKLPDVVQLVRSKVELLVDAQVGVLWSAVQRELDPESTPAIIDHKGLLEPSWLKYKNAHETRGKLAAYVVELKPRLLVEAAKEGRTAVPLRVPGLVDIASWKSASAAERLTEQERSLATCIQRLSKLVESLSGRDEADLEMALGLLPQSRLLTEELPAIERVGDQPPKLRRMCYELRKLVLLVDSLLTRHRPIQTLLHQFKLGLEVIRGVDFQPTGVIRKLIELPGLEIIDRSRSGSWRRRSRWSISRRGSGNHQQTDNRQEGEY